MTSDKPIVRPARRRLRFRGGRPDLFLRVAFGFAVGCGVAQELVALYLYLKSERSYAPLLEMGWGFLGGALIGFVPAAVAIALRREPSRFDFLVGAALGIAYVLARWLTGA